MHNPTPGPRQPPQAGPGAIITVTTFDPNIAADGQCSLIEAIVNANDDAATHADCPVGSGGGGICNAANSGLTANLTINNSTNAGNQAMFGGGVSLTVGSGPSPDVRGAINRSTISNNRALDPGGSATILTEGAST